MVSDGGVEIGDSRAQLYCLARDCTCWSADLRVRRHIVKYLALNGVVGTVRHNPDTHCVTSRINGYGVGVGHDVERANFVLNTPKPLGILGECCLHCPVGPILLQPRQYRRAVCAGDKLWSQAVVASA
jgi:hypothetical protein